MASLIRSCGLAVADLACQFGRMGSNRAKRGLYAGKDVGFGNMVSHSNRKTRRKFSPNAQHKRVWSDTLQAMVPFNLTTAALRMIDKWGGLDNYLLNTSDIKLNSISGIEVKRRIEDRLARLEVARSEHMAELKTRREGEDSKAMGPEDMDALPDFIKEPPPGHYHHDHHDGHKH